MKNILLICDLFSSEASTSTLALKNLQSLGCNVKVWDIYTNDKPPEGEFDLSIKWSNREHDHDLVKAKKRALVYLEDNDYINKIDPKHSLKNQIECKNFLFTFNKLPGLEKYWLPIGCDLDIQFKKELPVFERSVLFVGTCRDDKRKNFAIELGNILAQMGISLVLLGNNWQGLPNWIGKAYYLKEYNDILNRFYIVVNQHVGEVSPSDKVHCINGVGLPLLINDNKVGYRECYPGAPVWDTIPELVEKIIYFFEHEEERRVLVEKITAHCRENFTYQKQIKKILDEVEKGEESSYSTRGLHIS